VIICATGLEYFFLPVMVFELVIYEVSLLFWSTFSQLHFYIKQRRAVHFAWLSGAGIYHGGLNFGAQHR
jgi:hypothetical protein